MDGFQALLASIQDEQDRQALQGIGERVPELKASILRQADYSRKLDEFKPIKDYADQWTEWRKKHYDDTQKKTKAEIRLEEELQAMRESRGEEVDFQQMTTFIDAKLRDSGIVTTSQFPELLEKAIAPQKQEIDNVLTGMSNVVTQLIPLAMRHSKEFDEILTHDQIEKMYADASKNGIRDINVAYDQFVAGRREEIRKKQFDEQIQKAKEEGLAEGRRNAAMSPEGQIPTDNGQPNVGHLQQTLHMKRSDAEKATEIPSEVRLGEGLSRFVAQKYREQQATQG